MAFVWLIFGLIIGYLIKSLNIKKSNASKFDQYFAEVIARVDILGIIIQENPLPVRNSELLPFSRNQLILDGLSLFLLGKIQNNETYIKQGKLVFEVLTEF